MEKSETRRKSNRSLFIIIGSVVASVVLAIVLFVVLGANKGKLIGKWTAEYGSWYYNFTSENRGGYGTDAFPDIPDQEFSYTDNGDSFTIQYDSTSSSITLKYRLEDDGKKLVVVDSFGSDTVYIRQ